MTPLASGVRAALSPGLSNLELRISEASHRRDGLAVVASKAAAPRPY